MRRILLNCVALIAAGARDRCERGARRRPDDARRPGSIPDGRPTASMGQPEEPMSHLVVERKAGSRGQKGLQSGHESTQ